MTSEQITSIQDWFDRYTGSFHADEQEIQINYDLKRDHSLRVVENMEILTSPEYFSENDRRIANVTALLHDIGRFEQFRDYQTFLDLKSVNHAELGLDILEREQVLFSLSRHEKECITDSIRYHNRAVLPTDLPEPVLLFSKLVRDADKIDIWKVVIDYFSDTEAATNNAIEFNLSREQKISDHIIETIMSGKPVNYRDLYYINDMKLTMAAWVFDLNFRESIQIILDRDYLSTLRSLLPDAKVDQVFEKIYDHIGEKNNKIAI